ncbi:MAG: hypothetical protein JNM55_21110 [Anaerolineales bacterium]|nr:hypothetical protein [Anaerolineales bacterium]
MSRKKTYFLLLLLIGIVILFPPDIAWLYYPPAPDDAYVEAKSIILYPIGLKEANAACPNRCIINVCVRWIPGPSPQCPHPGPGGGCCTDYEQECDPDCEDPDPPPAALPPSINGTVTCTQWGSNGWCRSNARLALTASDPQGYSLTISGNAGGPFSCAGSCTIALPVGSGTATYTVVATQSGKSASGSTAWKYDPQPPISNLTASGTEGLNDWYVSPVNLTATGSDVLSGLTSVSVIVDGRPASASEILNDGIHEVIVTSVDNAGNIGSVTREVLVDTSKPILDVFVNGTSGLNEWFISPVTVTAFDSDDVSGILSTEYRIDGNEWHDGESTRLAGEGEHIVNIRSTDNAGNTASGSLSFKIDLTPPTSSFTTPLSTSPVRETVQIKGTSEEETSGLSAVEISFDDYTWMPLSVTSGQWSSPWDTTQMPNGTYSIFIRATDLAGNREDPVRMNVVVGNPAPHVDIPFSWMISDPLPIKIQPGPVPLAGGQIIIHDPKDRWPARRYTFEAGEIPTLFLWDRRFRDQTLAVPGRYRIEVEAWDKFGNTGQATGTIIIEDGPKATITQTPTRTITPSVSPSPTFHPTRTATSRPSIPVQPPIDKPKEHISLPKLTTVVLWPALGLLGLFAGLSSASLSDPRPRSLRRMSKTITRIIDQENITHWKG